MTRIAPTPLASALDALAAQLLELRNRPTQQAAAQTAALADRIRDLARMLKAVDFRRGVWLDQTAERVTSRAMARPYLSFSADELTELVVTLQTAAGFARKAAQRQQRPLAGHWGGGDAA
ncbi:hypothetical protein A6A40_17160 (plasmid) [Azospirillum humicireducens]|uniref:Uncharacterized protein n=1 Tax=Azospirillum humicireducens TaxID=1226968 RepID=A0A2R4VQQ3_9PROT|nr:hypothetical protein [Azospirillum humicireducens]AWB06783.1 hypothetical protein A6A40_17160 [Azospirillum humicireducens]